MVFLPPDHSTPHPNTYRNENTTNQPCHVGGENYVTTTAQGQVQYPTPGGDGVGGGGVTGALYPDREYTYQCVPQSVILVQVNPGETFTIQAEGVTQCIPGPAQVPMVSPNGAIPPIHVPHGYISQVIEENGLRRVVVIPEMSHFAESPVGQQIISPQPGLHHLSMQHGPLNYMQQASVLSPSQQTPIYQSSGEHLPVFHQQHMTYVPTDANLSADSTVPGQPQLPQYQLRSADMDPASSPARAQKQKEHLQKKLAERQNQHKLDAGKNPSPSSISSSSSSYAATPSPNSSPDSSPRIMGSMQTYSNGINNPRKSYHMSPPHLLGNPPHYHQHSPNHSTSFIPRGMNGCGGKKPLNSAASPRPNSDDMSSGSSSSGGSPRRLPANVKNLSVTSLDSGHQYQGNQNQKEAPFYSNTGSQEPFPTYEGMTSMKEYLSAINKPEVCETAPRSATIKWSLKYSLSKDMEESLKGQKIIYEVFLSDKGKDPSRFRSIHKDSGTFFVIPNLKPGMEYHTRVLAEIMNKYRGSFSETTSFRTLSCPPDTPGAPKLMNSTKNSIGLKWAAPQDNGEKIIKYHLEWDEGKKGSGFGVLYSNSQKQYKVNKLQPSHNYTFRLNSVNKMGASPWSPEVTYSTAGTAPDVPDPPRLFKAYVHSLVLTWSRVSGGSGDAASGHVKFALEKDDPTSGYGFQPIYDGPDTRVTVKNLNRCSKYSFRSYSYNNDGKSNYSVPVTYQTLPDRPGVPGRVLLKGKAHSSYFRVCWDPPKDDGGAEVTKYVLECLRERGQQGSVLYSGPDREFLVENALPGQPYRLRVYCASGGGTSVPSDAVVITPPAIVPGACAPPRAGAKSKPNIVSLHWDPPNYNGGSPITAFEVAMETHLEEEPNVTSKPGDQVFSFVQVYYGSGLDYSVPGLKPGTIYKFIVRAVNKAGAGPFSEMAELETSAGMPEKPDVPEPELVTSSSVLLSWKEPHDNGSEITGYSIEWFSTVKGTALQQTSSCLSHHFQHLASNTSYFFRVSAQNAVGKSSYSDVASVTTLPSCPCQVPRVWQGCWPGKRTLGDAASDEEGSVEEEEEEDEGVIPSPAVTAFVEWENPESNGADITSYILEVIQVTKSVSKKKTSPLGVPYGGECPTMIEVEEVGHLLENLLPDTEYRIRVKAVNEMGQGEFSAPVIIETQPLPPDPPVLECSCTYSGLKLKWGEVDSSSNTYLLQMKEKHGRFQTIYSGLGRAYRMNRLSERTTYHLRINARNHAGEGPFSPTYKFTTTTAPPPQLKQTPFVTVKEDIATITWEEIELLKDSITYVVNIEDCDNPSYKQSFMSDRPRLTYGPLEPGKKYRAQVAAVRHIFPSQVETGTKLRDHSENSAKDPDSVTGEQETGQNSTQNDEPAEKLEPEIPEPEQITGMFSNWLVFELPLSREEDSKNDVAAVRRSEVMSASNLLKTAPTSMPDEYKAGVLLAAFFVFAVLLAFLVQCLVS